MGELKYTLFYMGFVLKKKKTDKTSNTWKIQPVNVGTGVLFSLSKCWPRFTADPGAASRPAELLSAGITYCQVSGPVTKEAFISRQCWWGGGDQSHRPSKLWRTRHRTLRMAQVQDSPFPIPSWLPFTFFQVHWKATIRETHASGCGTAWVEHACLGETASNTRVSQIAVVEDVSYKQFSF